MNGRRDIRVGELVSAVQRSDQLFILDPRFRLNATIDTLACRRRIPGQLIAGDEKDVLGAGRLSILFWGNSTSEYGRYVDLKYPSLKYPSLTSNLSLSYPAVAPDQLKYVSHGDMGKEATSCPTPHRVPPGEFIPR